MEIDLDDAAPGLRLRIPEPICRPGSTEPLGHY
ncbi:MAG: hypothetical protein JWL72_1807, partial [Ilumatobacteraceae bacterium]|nr:hypothetical protein [Ilumatobacteraceae bacterium]